MEERAESRSRLLPQMSPNVPTDDDDDADINQYSPATSEHDSQRLLVEDDLDEESSQKRPQAWKNSPSWLRSPRPQRIQPLDGRTAGICYACEKLIPKKRRSLRRVVLLGLGIILALYGTDVFLLAFVHELTRFRVIGSVLSIFMLGFFSNDVHHILQVWGKPGQIGDGLASWPTDFSRDINPIPCHSHNDYWRLVPLYSAIGAGCISVEADIWLFEDELYVGHSIASLTRNRTLHSLYIEPLLDILLKQNPTTPFHDGQYSLNGVFDTRPDQSLVLLIDFKTPGVDLWPYVLSALAPLRERRYLTYIDGDRIVERPITVVGTGNTPFEMVASKASNPDLDVFYDAPISTMGGAGGYDPSGTLPDEDSVRNSASAINDVPVVHERSPKDHRVPADHIGSIKSTVTQVHDPPPIISPTLSADSYNTTNSFYASGSFNDIFGRLIDNEFSTKQLQLLRDQVRGTHQRGLKARYWELPYWPISLRNHVWDVLVKEGVDMLNVDDLKGATERDWRLPHAWWYVERE